MLDAQYPTNMVYIYTPMYHFCLFYSYIIYVTAYLRNAGIITYTRITMDINAIEMFIKNRS